MRNGVVNSFHVLEKLNMPWIRTFLAISTRLLIFCWFCCISGIHSMTALLLEKWLHTNTHVKCYIQFIKSRFFPTLSISILDFKKSRNSIFATSDHTNKISRPIKEAVQSKTAMMSLVRKEPSEHRNNSETQSCSNTIDKWMSKIIQ